MAVICSGDVAGATNISVAKLFDVISLFQKFLLFKLLSDSYCFTHNLQGRIAHCCTVSVY